jgi:MOSC domain-containing protein YiiM
VIGHDAAMRSPLVVSVNAAHARVLQEKPRLLSAIDKVPRQGPVAVKDLGLEGDQVGDVNNHGGTFQALYAYAAEDLQHWERELGGPLRPGTFGENLTTRDIDLNQCVIGEEWSVGTARLTVSSVRTPGLKFQRWMSVQGFDVPDWTARFAAHGRPGVYLTVLDRGFVAAGDFIDVLRVPDHGVTVGTVSRALHQAPELLPVLLEIDGLPPEMYDRAQAYVDARG